ncbi:MAG: hypothetical protein KC442_09115 [Thermomicrobiales bacterium]|nr:hypothetical protein [Thermomicrobiales bacterium]
MFMVRWLSAITTLLVLVQAALIGQALYQGQMSLLGVHGWLGSGSFVLAILLAGAIFLAVQRGELPRGILVQGVIVVLLMVAQLGLGYMGRRNGMAAAVHIPNGVIIAGLLSALLASTFLAPRGAAVRA